MQSDFIFYECMPYVYICGKKKVSAKYKCDISTSTYGTQLVKQFPGIIKAHERRLLSKVLFETLK